MMDKFKTRKELWEKKDELKRQIDAIFGIIQNPIVPTDEELKRADKALTEFESYLNNTIWQLGEYLKSNECKEEEEFYKKQYIIKPNE